jgi:hypothetical protein
LNAERGGNEVFVLVLAVPASLLGLGGLLFLAGRLDHMRVRTTVRMVSRPSVSPERAEAVVTAELASYFDDRPLRPVEPKGA